jgi:SP family arabinose:H+ symporter-like MFS transporter
MYYSTDIFKAATGDANAAFTSSVWIGFVNLIATFIAILFVDMAGRKPLLLVGNAVQVIGLVAVGYIYKVNPHSHYLLWGVITYTAAFAMAMGPIPWILCSEIFPAKLRGRAMSIATFAIWLACYLVSQTFPFLLKHLGPTKTFWFYGACSALTFAFVLVLVPETKGRSLEEIEKSWQKQAEA